MRRCRRIPFIFYSATYVRPDDEQFAMALGAVRYLIKPLEAEVFLHELRAVLQQWAGRAAPSPAAPLDDAASHALHESALARKLEDKMAQLEAGRTASCARARRNTGASTTTAGRLCRDERLEGTILEMSPQVATLSKGQYKREDLIGTSVNALYADAAIQRRHPAGDQAAWPGHRHGIGVQEPRRIPSSRVRFRRRSCAAPMVNCALSPRCATSPSASRPRASCSRPRPAASAWCNNGSPAYS